MADLTETQIQELITAAHTAILDAVQNPKPDYRIGEQSFTWSAYLKFLKDSLEMYRTLLTTLPWEETTVNRDY